MGSKGLRGPSLPCYDVFGYDVPFCSIARLRLFIDPQGFVAETAACIFTSDVCHCEQHTSRTQARHPEFCWLVPAGSYGLQLGGCGESAMLLTWTFQDLGQWLHRVNSCALHDNEADVRTRS